MKRKNFMVRFAITLMAITLFPLSTIAISILIPILVSIGEIDGLGILFTFGIWLLFNSIALLCFLIVGYFAYKVENPERLYEDENFIDTKQFVKLRKSHVKCVKARRFILIYTLDFYIKPWITSSLTVYFNSKDEIVDFIKENDFIIKYIREKDLIKLGLKEDSYE